MHRRTLGSRTLVALLVAGTLSGCGGPGNPESRSPSGGPTTGTEVRPSPTASPTEAPATPIPATEPPATAPPAWALAWSDEFDGPAGTLPDPATWRYDIGGAGWGNNERQFYTNDATNASLDGNGNLVLTVLASDGSFACHYGPCDYTSARLLTKGRYEVQHGRIEARIKVPDGFGLWPAFWMLGADIDQASWPASGEIDIMEFVGRRPNEILGTIHGPGYSGGSGFTQTVDLGVPVADDFHTFAIEWWSGHIGWFLDGVPFHEASPADVAPNPWVFDHPFFMVLNVAVGGNLGGPVDPDLALPKSMAVDYIRVYEGTTP